MTYLEVFNVSKVYGTNTVLRNINLKIEKGEFVSILGHSGCGKSTLLSIMAGLESPTTGDVLLEGNVVNAPGPDRCVVFQNYSLLPWLTIYDNVKVVVDVIHSNLAGKEKEAIVKHYLEVVGLWEHRHKRPKEVSGGMKQRTAIARAFAAGPKVLLMDEPFGALDALTRTLLQDELLKVWEQDRKTVVMVTHDIDEAILLSDRIVVMTNGPGATIGKIFKVNLPRPRDRKAIINESECLVLKEKLLHLLTVDYVKKE